jgi:monooxygenase
VNSSSHIVDVLIIGAGISGISAASHLSKRCPGKNYAILEQRAQLGGTWDLFRYPGIRSDSDMETLGFRFQPWTGDQSIADGADILRYLQETVHDQGVTRKIHYNRKVDRVAWSTADASWLVEVDGPDGPERWQTNYLWMCAGYYNYDNGYTPEFPGIDSYKGLVIHPQHWPEDVDFRNKEVVVIGSGATAFTLMPNLAKQAQHITMLQRSPTYVVTVPSHNKTAQRLRRILPPRLAYWVVRWMNIVVSAVSFWAARRWPLRTKKLLIDLIRKQLPAGFDVERHFTPHYMPWDQRICAVPDGDFFRAIKSGSVSLVTDHIKTFTEHGIQLASGEELRSDVVVTATGLVVHMFGGATVNVDGRNILPGELMTYKGIMYADVPNLSVTFGYTNASWTLKADLASEYTCRVLNHMDKIRARIATPQRAAGTMPRQGKNKPWRLAENYLLDIHTLRRGSIDDGVLKFS